MINNPILNKLTFSVACVLCGWIAAFAMPPASFWPCMFVGLSGLYYLFSKTTSAGQAFIAGLLFGLGFFVTGLWWIGNALLVEGNDFAWVWPISVIGLPTLLGLFTGTYLAMARLCAPPDTFKGFFAFCFFLTFSEWARGNAFTGFPWNLYGYVWADHIDMAQMAHYTGAYGMTVISIIWAALGGFLLISKKPAKTIALCATFAALSIGLVYAGGKSRLAAHETVLNKDIGVIVVQPNIPQNMKWDPVAIQNNFLKITSLSKGATFAAPKPKDIFVVWPETAISPSVYTVPENMTRIRAVLESYETNSYLVTGILRRMDNEDGPHFANSIMLLNKRMSALDVYDKSHLVPFGEFIPFQKWIPLKPVAAFRGFEPGGGATILEHKDVPAFSPLICYEVIFADKVVPRSGKRPEWIVNATNDGWYGDSAGPYQHFAQTRLRAIEEGIPVVRSANTGISGVIDSYGRVIERADIFQEAAIVTYLPKPLTEPKPPWPWLIQILLPVIALILMGNLLILKRH